MNYLRIKIMAVIVGIVVCLAVAMPIAMLGKRMFHREAIGEKTSSGHVVMRCTAVLLSEVSSDICWSCFCTDAPCRMPLYNVTVTSVNVSGMHRAPCHCTNRETFERENNRCIIVDNLPVVYKTNYFGMLITIILVCSITPLIAAGIAFGVYIACVVWLYP
jgi:hypothetical protein